MSTCTCGHPKDAHFWNDELVGVCFGPDCSCIMFVEPAPSRYHVPGLTDEQVEMMAGSTHLPLDGLHDERVRSVNATIDACVRAVALAGEPTLVELLSTAQGACVDALRVAQVEGPQEILDLVNDGYTLIRRAHNRCAALASSAQASTTLRVDDSSILFLDDPTDGGIRR